MKNGKCVIHDGIAWYRENILHKEDGPAIEWADGTRAFFLNGNQLTEEEFSQWFEKKTLQRKTKLYFKT